MCFAYKDGDIGMDSLLGIKELHIVVSGTSGTLVFCLGYLSQ